MAQFVLGFTDDDTSRALVKESFELTMTAMHLRDDEKATVRAAMRERDEHDNVKSMTAWFPSSISVACDGLDRVDVLRALYEHAPLAHFLSEAPPEPSRAEMEAAVNGPIEYCGGRAINVDFTYFPMLATRGYDKQAGEGACRRVIDELRQREQH